MLIDATTLSDLEVFHSPDGSEGLFQLIDRTQTASGRKALRRRVGRPSSDLGEIRRTQDAVRFLMRHQGLATFDAPSLEAVERYLRSNIEAKPALSWGPWLDYLWVALRYRDVLTEVSDGVAGTIELFEQLATLAEAMEALRPPALIAQLGAELRSAAQAVSRAHAGGGNPLQVDRALRGDLEERIQRAHQAVAELDALNAMAASTIALGWTMPELVEADAFLLDAEAVVHPFVDSPVPNPIQLAGGKPLIFLTGPNMGGKTTYLRGVALLVFLAQLGMGVPAQRARLTPVEALFTSLNPADNLKAGLSYFLAEVLRVRAAATLLADGRRALVLFDEVFKGTNVRDALEASAEVILGFAGARRSGLIFSSHLSELVEILAANTHIRFCCFDGEIVSGAPRYDYRLRDGVSEKRFGRLLLRQAGIPELMARIGGGGTRAAGPC